MNYCEGEQVMAWTTNQNRDFIQVLLAMGEMYETPVSTARGEMFLRAIEDLPFDAVKAAANSHARHSKFFPRPADLRELVEGNLDDRAEQAWNALLPLIHRVGYTGTPTWTDPAMERAALSLFGSWRRLCEQLPAGGPELLGHAKNFRQAYLAYARTAAAAKPELQEPSREDAKALLQQRLRDIKRVK